MSSKDLARRATAQVVINGVDISDDIAKYLLSLDYTDNEEDAADDLQIKLQDREDIWLSKWLNDMIETWSGVPFRATQSMAGASNTFGYTARDSGGVTVYEGPTMGYAVNGSFADQDPVAVFCICRGWAAVDYGGSLGFVYANQLQRTGEAAPEFNQVAVGSRGSSVMTCQKMLKALGYDLGTFGANGDGIDGVFGWKTRQAVWAYQSNCGMTARADGVCGPNTFGWLHYQSGIGTGDGDGATGELIIKGMPISASITRRNWTGNGEDETLQMGSFELDSLRASGPPNTVVIKGTSLFYSTAIRQTERDRAWEQYSLKGIAQEVAKRGGLRFQYDSESNPYYDRIEQTSQSDISFLMDLVHDAGISMKIYNNTMILFDQATYEAKNPVRTFCRGDRSYEKWDFSTGEADSKYDSCRVTYTDPRTKNVFTGWAYVDDYDEETEEHQILKITRRVASTKEAEALAKKMLSPHCKSPGARALCQR